MPSSVVLLEVIGGNRNLMWERNLAQRNLVGKKLVDIPEEVAFETHQEVPDGTFVHPHGSASSDGFEQMVKKRPHSSSW